MTIPPEQFAVLAKLLGIPDLPHKEQEALTEELGGIFFARFNMLVETRLSTEDRTMYAEYLSRADMPGMIEFLSTRVPDLDALIKDSLPWRP